MTAALTAPRVHLAPWRIVGSAIVVRVHLTPRSSRDAIDGITALPDGPALKARVRAIPEDGKANAALEDVLARTLRLGRRAVSVTGGHTSRLKSVTISGDARAVMHQLEALLP